MRYLFFFITNLKFYHCVRVAIDIFQISSQSFSLHFLCVPDPALLSNLSTDSELLTTTVNLSKIGTLFIFVGPDTVHSVLIGKGLIKRFCYLWEPDKARNCLVGEVFGNNFDLSLLSVSRSERRHGSTRVPAMSSLRDVLAHDGDLCIGCLKSNDTLTIYLAEALSCFQFVLSTFLFFHHEPCSIVY